MSNRLQGEASGLRHGPGQRWKMPSTAKRILVNLGLLLASVLVILACTEAFLREFPNNLPASARVKIHWMKDNDDVERADPYVGYLYPPNHHGRVVAGDVRFDYATDSLGFRNPSPLPDSAGIVVIGDSEGFGYGVDYDSTWSTLVEEALPGIRLVNLSLPGYAPKQYLRVYERYGTAFQPKLLLFGLFPGNDLQDEQEFDRWLRAGRPGRYATWKFRHGRSPSLLQSILERSYVYWFVAETFRTLRRRFRSTPPMEFPDHTRLIFAPSFLENQVGLAKPDQPVFQSVMESIEKTQAIAASHGTAFLVLVFPTKEDVYLPLRGDTVPPLLPSLVEALRSRGIPYLDLTGPMQEQARQEKRLFFQVDGHPDAAGYRVIAAAVLARIERDAGQYGLGGLSH